MAEGLLGKQGGCAGKVFALARGDLPTKSVGADNPHREAQLRRQKSAEVIVKRLKERLRRLTSRNWGVSLRERIRRLNEYTRGWLAYFFIADMKEPLRDLDQWRTAGCGPILNHFLRASLT